jgi:hypothetical protein
VVSLLQIHHHAIDFPYLILTHYSTAPVGTPVERNRRFSANYRSQNPEKAKTSARISNYRARARKSGITDRGEIDSQVWQWESKWQEGQAQASADVSSNPKTVDFKNVS